MLKAVIFDMDGVLINSEALYYEANRRLLLEYGHTYTKEYNEQFIGSTCEYMWTQIAKDFNLSVSPEELNNKGREYKHIVVREHGGQDPVPYAADCVRRLKEAGYLLAVASSSPMDSIERNMKEQGIYEMFDYLVSGATLNAPKPRPDIFLHAAKNLGVMPGECLVVEDSCNGVMAAVNAGMVCVGYINPDSGNQDLSAADYLLESFENADPGFFELAYCHTVGVPLHVFDTKRLSAYEMDESDLEVLKKLMVSEKDIFDMETKNREMFDKQYMENYREYMYKFFEYGLWAFKSKDTGDTVCFAGFDTDDHLGYIVKPKYRGLGYAFEAAMGSIVYVKDIGLREVFLNVADENTASRRLAAKLGFKNIGGDEYRLEIC